MEAFTHPICQNCGAIGQARFNGFCCVMCIQTSGEKHGAHCRGHAIHDIPDPGWTGYRIKREVWRLNDEVKTIKAELRKLETDIDQNANRYFKGKYVIPALLTLTALAAVTLVKRAQN